MMVECVLRDERSFKKKLLRFPLKSIKRFIAGDKGVKSISAEQHVA